MSEWPARRRIVIVGGTSTIAEQCARLWVAQTPCDVVLMVRSGQRAEPIAVDLRTRSPHSRVEIIETGFTGADAVQDAVEKACAGGAIDIALIAHGMLPDQAACERDLAEAVAALEINGVSTALFAEAFASRMAATGTGTLAIIGSVAGDRGRKSNYVYGAAKGLVARYAQGLQHRFAGTGVHVVLIKPGPTATPMTAHLTQAGKRLAPADAVARTIVAGIASRRPVVYAPPLWRVIMLIVMHLPRFVFHRTNF